MNTQLGVENERFQEYALKENHLFRLTHVKGCAVKSLAGKAWITAYGVAEDFILAPGDTFIVPNDRLALVEAIGDCHLQIARRSLVAGPSNFWLALKMLQQIREKCAWISRLSMPKKGGAKLLSSNFPD